MFYMKECKVINCIDDLRDVVDEELFVIIEKLVEKESQELAIDKLKEAIEIMCADKEDNE